MTKITKLLTVILLTSSLPTFTWAENSLRLPNIFGDGMVLQADKPINLWGWSAKGTPVQVSLGNQVVKTTSNKMGAIANMSPSWRGINTRRGNNFFFDNELIEWNNRTRRRLSRNLLPVRHQLADRQR